MGFKVKTNVKTHTKQGKNNKKAYTNSNKDDPQTKKSNVLGPVNAQTRRSLLIFLINNPWSIVWSPSITLFPKCD